MRIDDGAPVANDQPHKRAGDVKVRAPGRKKFLVMFAYLWLVLALFVMHEAIVLAQYDSAGQGIWLVTVKDKDCPARSY